MHSVYEQLFEIYQLPGILYNGDTDMACNFIGNNWFTKSLDRRLVSEWKGWRLPNDAQISGFVEKYDFLTFYTIKGAGHMVPQWKPAQSLYILLQLLYQQNPHKLRYFESQIWGKTNKPMANIIHQRWEV